MTGRPVDNRGTTLVGDVVAAQNAAASASASRIAAEAAAATASLRSGESAASAVSAAASAASASTDAARAEVAADTAEAILAAGAVNTPFTPTGNIAATNVQAAVAEVDAEKVAKAGDTMTGPLNVQGDVTAAQSLVTGNAGSERRLRLLTGTASRWELVADGVAESGSNAGSNLLLRRYDDLGTLLGTAISISRASGIAELFNRPTVAGIGVATFTAEPVNRLVNGSMQLCQAGVIVGAAAHYDATTGFGYWPDQWVASLSTTPGGTLRITHVASDTPGGSTHRMRATVQVLDSSMSSGDFYAIAQPIEGNRIASARFGTAGARQLVLRMGVRSSIAGIYGVSISNAANNRSWVGVFTISAGEVNTDLVRTIVIPGDTTGTWLTNTGIGLWLRVCLSAGSGFQTTTGWIAGNGLTTSAQANFMGTSGATFELFDVGLYVDPLATGVAPEYVSPPLSDETAECQRYMCIGGPEYHMIPAPAATYGSTHPVHFPVRMRDTPTVGVAYSSTSNTGSHLIAHQSTSGFTHTAFALAGTNCTSVFTWYATSRL